jgi:acetamidase/formamidase
MNKLAMLVLVEPLIVSHLGFAAGQAPKTTRHIAPTPPTVTWGYFDPRRPPALRVSSGDTVEVEALIAAGVQDMELAGVIQPALREIDRDVKDRGEIPHILTGPIYVQGA